VAVTLTEYQEGVNGAFNRDRLEATYVNCARNILKENVHTLVSREFA
jgi:hypothetical protein